MKTTKKALLALVCAVALVFGSVFATYAYLTSTTDTVTNTFTVGKVEITLDEAKVNEYGEKVMVKGEDGTEAEADRVTENNYKLIPGQTYVKDPTVHVAEDSEDAWLFVKVENGLADYESDEKTIASQMTTNGWKQLVTEDGNVENVFYHDGVVEAGKYYPVFEKFIVAGDANVVAAAKHTITVTAYAVQGGFESAAAAWEAAPSTWTK